MKSFFVFCLSFFLFACASPPKEPHVNPALLSGESYFIDNGMPVREVKNNQQFFFKKCNVDNRGPYPAKTNYDCNEP
jgi:hypothetical protein